MGDFVNRGTLEYRRSVNDPDYLDPPWLEVPRESANATLLRTVPARYLTLTGDVLSEMSQAEKDAVDAAELAARVAEAKTQAKAFIDALSDEQALLLRNSLRVVYMSIVETRNKVNQIIQASGLAVAPLPNRTWSDLKTAVRNQIDAETGSD